MDPSLSELFVTFPGRKHQIEQLRNLFGYKEEPFSDCIYVYGDASVGKTSIITSLLMNFGIKYVYVNLVECYSSKILFESILNKLSGHKIDPKRVQPYAKCENLMDFIYYLKMCAEEADLNKSVIVLDKAEQLRNMEYNLLPGFLRLKELCGLPISVILLSQITFQNYYNKTGILDPLTIYFPQYNRDELLDILLLDYDYAQDFIKNNCDEDVSVDVGFYKNYLNIFLSVFYRTCRDLSELRHMAKLNFTKYCQPIINKECTITDSMALWRYVSPILKSSLEVLYLRISSAAEPEVTQKPFTLAKENVAQSLELPFYSKYLLIAAYIASYNPAKDDKRLFLKHHGKKTKTLRDVKTKSKVSEQLTTQLGPKAFNFYRLIAIFYAIVEGSVELNNNLLAQISTLVELQLLSTVSENSGLDGQKYKCMVSFDFIQTIARMVDFNIRKYLSDFSHL